MIQLDPKCKGCAKAPHEIRTYVMAAKGQGCSPLQYVRDNEGTFNPVTGAFWCDSCYIKVGMPRGKA